MTKNRSIKIAVLVLALALITSCFVGTTFAKYVSQGSAAGSLTVAKWAVSFAGEDITPADEGEIQINLFDTILDTNEEDGDEETTGEKDVKSGLIAPGTTGEFDLEVTNDSEVSAAYSVSFTVTGAAVPLEFSVDGGSSWDTAIATQTGTILYTESADDNDATINVKWRWAFEQTNVAAGDLADTTLGAYDGEAPKVTVTANVTVTQVD